MKVICTLKAIKFILLIFWWRYSNYAYFNRIINKERKRYWTEGKGMGKKRGTKIYPVEAHILYDECDHHACLNYINKLNYKKK